MTRRREWIWWLAALGGLVGFLWLFNDILLPFVAGLVIAYLLDPIVDQMERLRLPRWVATAATLALFFVIAVSALLLLAPIVEAQLGRFLEQLPRYTARVRDFVQPILLDLLEEFGDGGKGQAAQAVGGMADKAIAFAGGVLSGVWSGGLLIFNILSLLVITPIVSFYLLRDWDDIVVRFDGLLPLRHRQTIRKLGDEVDEVLAGFIRGQAVVCLFLGAFYAIGLTLVGLDLGLVIGIFAGLVSFIPYLGAITGLLLSLLPALTQFGSDFWSIGLVVGVFALGQFIEGNFLSPRVIGDKTKLHPVWIMFALLAGGALMGFVGVLVAVPIAASAGVLIRFLLRRYRASPLYLGAAAIPPTVPPPPDLREPG